MYQATERIYETLLRKDIKCRIREVNKLSLVEVVFNGKSYANIVLSFISTSDNNDVAIRAANVVKFPPERLEKVCAAVNEVNLKYRYAKFVVSAKENAVHMHMDVPAKCENVGEVCEELMARALLVLENAYQALMQAVWA